MPRIGEGWGATVKESLDGALVPIREERAAGQRVQLEFLEIEASFHQAFSEEKSASGEISANIGPASIKVGGSLTTKMESTGNLTLRARYVTVPDVLPPVAPDA